jgi:hypothetical protein
MLQHGSLLLVGEQSFFSSGQSKDGLYVTPWGGRGFRPHHPVVILACAACQLRYDGEAEYCRHPRSCKCHDTRFFSDAF